MTRTLTEDDIQAISEAVRQHNDCVFSDDDMHDIKTLLQWYRESTTAIRKGVIGLVLLGALALALLGAALQFK